MKRITYRPDAGARMPLVGDGLRSSRTSYLIVQSRRMDTRDGVVRYALGVRIVEDDELAGRAVHPLFWDKRKRRSRAPDTSGRG